MSGRPRDPELEKRLLAATWRLLVEQGYAELTLSRVATEAEAHRTDVYRRWSSKSELVSDTLAEHLPSFMARDTGSLSSDLAAFIDEVALIWSSAWIDGLIGWLADIRHDPGAEASRTMLENRRRPVLAMLDRAVRRGEIDEVVDPAVLGDLLEGPLMHRRLYRGLDLTPEFLDTVTQSVYRYLTTT